MSRNAAVRRVRPSITHRVLRALLPSRIATFLAVYAVTDLTTAVTEVLVGKGIVAPLVVLRQKDLDAALAMVPGVAMTAQTGALAVITLALALVTLVAQRDEAAGDTRIYYHHSLAFEIAASSLALMIVLALQSAWPLQVAIHAAFGLVDDAAPKFGLTMLHLAWLALNVVAVGRFVSVTLRFVQRQSRERMRAEYVAHVLLEADIRRRLRESVYLAEIGSLGNAGRDGGLSVVAVPPFIGANAGEPEVMAHFPHPVRLADVWLPPLRWAVRSWWRRSQAAGPPQTPRSGARTLRQGGPRLRLPVPVDGTISGNVALCHRLGGVPMNRAERIAVRLALRFSRAPHAS